MEQRDRDQASTAIPGAPGAGAGEILRTLDAVLAAAMLPAGRIAAAAARQLADRATAAAREVSAGI